VYLISDTHFDDPDCKFMSPDWPTPEEHIAHIKKFVHKNDTLIHLGDVGNPEWLAALKCYKVLIMGNHDQSKEKFAPFFDEIYGGPLMIGEKLILSHEPLDIGWAFNIHGHDHNPRHAWDCYHFNLAANVVYWDVYDLKHDFINGGWLAGIDSIHRITINNASNK
jgi:calcineurin-like phosphoesterase family protein